MFDIFLGRGFFSGVASTLTIVGFAFGVYQFIKNQRARILFAIRRNSFVDVELPNGFEINIRCGEAVGKALFRDLILIMNKTNITITDDEFVDLPQLKRSENGQIYQTTLLNLEGTGSADILVHEDRLLFKNLMIPRDTGIVLEIFHDGCLSVALQSVPKRLRDLSKYRPITFYNRESVKILTAALFAFGISIPAFIVNGISGVNFPDFNVLFFTIPTFIISTILAFLLFFIFPNSKNGLAFGSAMDRVLGYKAFECNYANFTK